MPSTTYRAIFSVLAFWYASISPTSTRAQTAVPTEPSVARSNPEAEFAEASKFFRDGDVAAALPLFVHLGETTNSPNVQLYVGYCHQDLGHDREAHRAFSRAVKLSLDPGNAKYAVTREAAQAELVKLNLRLASLTISLVELPAEFVVRLDGEVVNPTLLGSPIIVDPGLHHVDAEAKGSKPVARDLSVDVGGSKTIALLFEKAVVPDVVLAPVVQSAPVQPTESGSRLTLPGYVAAGLGVAGLGTFVIAGIQARSTYNKLQATCPSGCSDATHRNDASQGRTYQTVANVGLALGIVGTLTGATLVYLGVTSEKATKASVDVDASAGLLKISYAGSF
jgi:hypothetical protein